MFKIYLRKCLKQRVPYAQVKISKERIKLIMNTFKGSGFYFGLKINKSSTRTNNAVSQRLSEKLTNALTVKKTERERERERELIRAHVRIIQFAKNSQPLQQLADSFAHVAIVKSIRISAIIPAATNCHVRTELTGNKDADEVAAGRCSKEWPVPVSLPLSWLLWLSLDP